MKAFERIAILAALAAWPACAVDDEQSTAPATTAVFVGVDPQDAQTIAAIQAQLPGWTRVEVPAGAAQVGAIFARPEIATYWAGDDCVAGYACVYQNGSGGGAVLEIQAGTRVSNLQNIACPPCTNSEHPAQDGTFNDQMTSWHNRSGQEYCWFVNKDYGGTKHTMPAGQQINVYPNENDEASSLRPCPGGV